MCAVLPSADSFKIVDEELSTSAKRALILASKVLQVSSESLALCRSSVCSDARKGLPCRFQCTRMNRVLGCRSRLCLPTGPPLAHRTAGEPRPVAWLQNLASGVLFGQKETFMQPFNEAIHAHDAIALHFTDGGWNGA